MSTLNIQLLCRKSKKKIPKLSPFTSWLSTIINPQWLELPMSRTHFHGPKDVRAIEVRLYLIYTSKPNIQCHSHEIQPSRNTKRRRDEKEKETMTKQTQDIKPTRGWGHSLSKWAGVCCQEPGTTTPFPDTIEIPFQTKVRRTYTPLYTNK